uniref:SWFGD domain-containing protein n=1 Tax=Parastrongyloides trichosuri TaxID=131310 RepID=A0A0N4ZW52_PARTI
MNSRNNMPYYDSYENNENEFTNSRMRNNHYGSMNNRQTHGRYDNSYEDYYNTGRGSSY